MMGRRTLDQERLFYSFNLEEAVPEDHLVREVLAWSSQIARTSRQRPKHLHRSVQIRLLQQNRPI